MVSNLGAGEDKDERERMERRDKMETKGSKERGVKERLNWEIFMQNQLLTLTVQLIG